MPVRRTKVRLSATVTSMRIRGGASHAPCQVPLDMPIYLNTCKDFAKKKSSKTFFVISKWLRVQRLAAQVPPDMWI